MSKVMPKILPTYYTSHTLPPIQTMTRYQNNISVRKHSNYTKKYIKKHIIKEIKKFNSIKYF